VPVISYLNYAYVAMLKNELYGLELRAPGGEVVMAQTMMPPGSDNGCDPASSPHRSTVAWEVLRVSV
jgi:hypothetical protein